ncbi:MAG: phosphatase PAP2 family protein [Clostridia bacterium]|nr:phosphatase PAP2 family protein [Clostridia bacterium]
MELLYFLEKLRKPVGDEFFQLVTYFGEDVLFLAMALILLWCIDKHKAYYILICGFVASLAGQLMKMTFKIDRPWVQDPDFQPVGSAKEAANDFSFPSGHTILVTSTWGATALSFGGKLLRIGAPILIFLVGLSRMYLGVHTPWDVLAGWGVGIAAIILLRPLMKKAIADIRVMWAVIAGLVALALGNLLLVSLTPADSIGDPSRLDGALKNAWTFMGLAIGLAIVYLMDSRVSHFETKAVWWAQILKVSIGLALLLTIKGVLKQPLYALTDGHHLADGIRYGLITVIGGGIWPLTFPWFAKLGKKA